MSLAILSRLCICLLLGWGRPCPAKPSLPARAMVKVYTDRDGLPQNTVWALTRDQDGMVWAGTLHGIGRYDGRGWITVQTPVPPASVLVNPNAAQCLSDGTLCFGTRNHGLLMFRHGTWSRHGKSEGLGSDNVNGVLESSLKGPDGKPILWAGTFDGGLSRLEQGRWVGQPFSGEHRGARIYALLEVPAIDGRPEIWVGTDQGVWILGMAGWRVFPMNGRLPGSRVRALAGVGAQVWIGFDEGGIAEWDGHALKIHGPANGLPRGPVHALLPGLKSASGPSLWATLGEQGPMLLEKGVWTEAGVGNQPALRASRSLLAADLPQGPHILWVGTEGGGVVRRVEGGWQHLAFPQADQDHRVLRILAGTGRESGELWFGTQSGGVWNLRDGHWRNWGRAEGLPHATVRDLAWVRFGGGDFLVAATHGGLARFRGGRWEPIQSVPEGTGTLRNLLFTEGAEGGRLWIATSRGVMSWDGRRWASYDKSSGLPSASVRCLLADEGPGGGLALFAGTDEGLARMEGGRFVSVPLPEHLLKAGVSALKRCSLPGGGRGLLVGSYGGGLALVRDAGSGWTAQEVTASGVPLRGEVVLSLQEDREGAVYAGTLRGILRIRVDATGGAEVERFGEEDGLPARECTQGSGVCDPDGRVWVGTAAGAAFLAPAARLVDRQPKPLKLLEAQAEALPGRMEEGAEIPPGNRRVSFDYALISHHREGDSRYQTQLEGLESSPTEWVAEGHREFTGLPHGKYLFKVWGRDYAGNRSGPVAFTFAIRPPVWASWWGRGLLVLVGCAAVWGGIQWRSRWLRMRNLELERAIAARTREVRAQKEALEKLTGDLERLNALKSEFLGMVAHDLRNPLNQISLISELALDPAHGDASGSLQRIMDAASRMGEMISSLLNKDALESGRLVLHGRVMSLAPILDACVQAFRERARHKGQRIVTAIPPELAAWVDPDRFREVMDNLLSNALKYSREGTEVAVTAEAGANLTILRVKDQGPGIPAAEHALLFQAHARLSPRPTAGEPSTGLGLSIAKGLVEAMGGRLRHETPAEGGAVFVVELAHQAP